MVKLKRNPKLRKDKPTPAPSSRSTSADHTPAIPPASPQAPHADPLGIIYLLLALVGFGAAAYVLCLATPMLAVGAMLICLFFFTRGSTVSPESAGDDHGISQTTTVAGP